LNRPRERGTVCLIDVLAYSAARPRAIQNRKQERMRRLALTLVVTLAFFDSAMAETKITCEGIMEHGSGGEYISSENKPTWWFSDEALTVCKDGEHCKVTGPSTRCKKDPDAHRCREIIRLDAISH
jgi:hypothetical protein